MADSDAKKTHDLISGLQLGDKKPSILLAEMRRLHQGSVNDNIFRELWLNRLPPSVKGILMGSNQSLPLEQLAETADRIAEYSQDSKQFMNAVTQPPANFYQNLNDTLSRIGDQLKWLTSEKRQHKSTGNKNNEPKDKKSDRPCFFHRKYGDGGHKNKRCSPDCPLHQEWLKQQNQHPKNA